MLFDNHHGKKDHMHIDGVEHPFEFESISQLRREFEKAIEVLGGTLNEDEKV